MSDRDDYVERITGWLVNFGPDQEMARQARTSVSLDGVYNGTSPKIQRLVRLAYLRGVRRGAALAWAAQQPVALRGNKDS